MMKVHISLCLETLTTNFGSKTTSGSWGCKQPKLTPTPNVYILTNGKCLVN